jgi:hypothetical protein
MSRSFTLSPEVPGGPGPNMRVDWTSRPPVIQHAHVLVEGWLEDDLVGVYPVFLVTPRAADVLTKLGATGFTLGDAEVATTADFEEIHPGLKLPRFRWLNVTGKPGEDDLGLTEDVRLVVSLRVLEALQKLNLNHCKVFAGLPAQLE